jgi:hypothetical protein
LPSAIKTKLRKRMFPRFGGGMPQPPIGHSALNIYSRTA